MKKGFFRRGMVLLLAAVMVMGMSVSAFAADGGNATQVTIADGDTPYISFVRICVQTKKQRYWNYLG